MSISGCVEHEAWLAAPLHCTDPMLIGDKIQQQPHGDTRPVLTCEVVLVVFFIKHEKNIVDSRYGDTSLLYYVDTMCTDDGWV